MKRRFFVQTLAAAPTAKALLPSRARAQEPETPAVPPLRFAPADAAGEREFRFFDARRVATLRRLCDVLEPAIDGLPSANEARVPEFLDFYIARCSLEKQQLYQVGLDWLDRESQSRFGRPFFATDDAQAAQLLSPLRQPWTYEPPTLLAAFLREARATVRAATRNSYEWDRAGRGRGGLYWKPVN
jgi:hypothetical protein